MLNRKKKNYTILGAAIINLIATIYVLTKVITKVSVPINIFATDLVGKMQSKYVLLIAPIIVLLISIVQVMYRKKTMFKTVTTGKLIEDALFAFIDGLLIIANWVFVIIGYNFVKTSLISSIGINPAFLVIILIGLIILAISSTFPINRTGSILGLRTKETMEDDKIWRSANRFNGFTMFISAIIIILLGFDFIIKGFNLALLIGAILLSVVLIVIVPRIYVKIYAKHKVEEIIE